MTSADAPVQYMPRTLHYYRALGYDRDNVWATHDHVPFTPLAKPLAESRVALITTASPPDFDGVKRVWSGRVSSPPPTLFTDNVAWDKESTHTNDRASFLPIEAVSTLASQGLVAGLTARFHGVPTEYSQRKPALRTRPKFSLAFVRMERMWPSSVRYAPFATRRLAWLRAISKQMGSQPF
jgi:D-proline reductase (dithiol) PrdB